MQGSTRFASWIVLGLVLVRAASPGGAARLRLVETSLTLPGAPAAVVSTDLDRDGHRDLAIFVVGSRWGEKVTWERSEMDDVEGLVEVLTVVPTLLDRRELWLFFGEGEGRLRAAGPPLEMPLSVLSLARGPVAAPLLALTDDGISSIDWSAGESRLTMRPLLSLPPVLAGTGTFVPGIRLAEDVTGDGRLDLLFPAPDGISIHPGNLDGFADEPTTRGLLPSPPSDRISGPPVLAYPLPEVREVTGDGRLDLVWRDPARGWARPWVAENRGEGIFSPARSVLGSSHEEKSLLAPLRSTPDEGSAAEVEALYFGALRGDGRAGLAIQVTDPEPDDLGMRKSIRWAESPPGTVYLHDTDAGLAPIAAPRDSFRMHGYAATGDDSEFQLPGGFEDLDGDGRLDLVTLSPQISVTRILGGLALGHVSLPMDFAVWCQQDDGSFAAVDGLDLSGKFRVDIGDLKIRNLPSFSGDFDGDGRIDFVQLGRGTKVTIHTGAAGCRFPTLPDLTLRLKKEPAHIDLVRVEDLDGDGRSDLVVTHPLPRREDSVVPPTRFDLYLSGGADR